MQCTAERYLQTSISGEWRHHWSIDRLRACDLSHMRFRQDSHYKHKVAFSILWLQNCCWRLMFCLRPVGTAVLQGLYGAHEVCCEEVFVQNKHSPVSSVRSTKRWGMGMRLHSWTSGESRLRTSSLQDWISWGAGTFMQIEEAVA